MGKVFKTGIMMAGVFVVAALLVCPAAASAGEVGEQPILVPGYLGDPGNVEFLGQNVAASQISISRSSFCDTEFVDETGTCWMLDPSVLDSSDTFFISEGISG